MFTLEDISHAHAQVKSGADFPKFAHNLLNLGVHKFNFYVEDGHSVYFGSENFSVYSESTYSQLNISEEIDELSFQNKLLTHQQGETDFPTFCRDCAETGIAYWTVDLLDKTCTYFDN